MAAERAPRLLVVYDQPELFLDMITARLPEESVACCRTAAELEALLATHAPEVVFTINSPGVPRRTHARIVESPSVKWIHVGGSGYDHLPPWDTARLTVTNGAGVLAPFLAETVIGAILTMNFGFPAYLRQQPKGLWRAHPWRTIAGQRLLIVGLGTIGREVARRGRALGMEVIGLTRSGSPDPAADEVRPLAALGDALGEADVVSLHLRLAEATHHLFDSAAFAAMKPGALFVNTSRGGIVDTSALLAALERGQLAGIYLDVFETEPLPTDHPLWRQERVVISPHCSDSVNGWQRHFAARFLENLDRWIGGEPLGNVVTPVGRA